MHTWTSDSCCGTFIYLWTMLQRYGIDMCTFAIGLIRVRSNCADVAITSCDIATLTCLFTSVQLKSCMEYSGAYSLIHLEWFQYVTQAPLDIREFEKDTSDAGSCGSTFVAVVSPRVVRCWPGRGVAERLRARSERLHIVGSADERVSGMFACR